MAMAPKHKHVSEVCQFFKQREGFMCRFLLYIDLRSGLGVDRSPQE